MATNITGKNIDLTDAIRDYINEKTDSLHNHFKHITEIDVEMDKNTHHQKGEVFHVRMNVQITCDVLHAEETKESLYAAVDVCRDDIQRQLQKTKSKHHAKQRKVQQTRRGLKSILSFWK